MTNNTLLSLPPHYEALMAEHAGTNIFGIDIDDSPLLRDLARQAWEITRDANSETRALAAIEWLVGTTLASTYTFNNVELESGAEFPDSVDMVEFVRWYVGLRNTKPTCDRLLNSVDAVASVINGFCDEDSLRLLSTQLAARVGDCAMYTITLGLLMAACGLCTMLELVGTPPHAWVHARIIGEEANGADRYIDLARRSHGVLESSICGQLKADTEKAPFKIKLV